MFRGALLRKVEGIIWYDSVEEKASGKGGVCILVPV